MHEPTTCHTVPERREVYRPAAAAADGTSEICINSSVRLQRFSVYLLRRTVSSEVFMRCLIRSTACKLGGTAARWSSNEASRITGMPVLLQRFCSVCNSGLCCYLQVLSVSQLSNSYLFPTLLTLLNS